MNKKHKKGEPGDYVLIIEPYKIRGRKINKKCTKCQTYLEHIWIRNRTLHDNKKYYWEHLCTRCSQCGLKYNVIDIG